MKIGAGEFKAKCLKIMDEVKKFRKVVVITKFGKPVAKLTPVEEDSSEPIFGCMSGSATIHGDIVNPIEEPWKADE